MIPARHLPEDWLVAWVSGTLSQAEAVVIATHLTLCPACRDRVELARVAAAGTVARAPEVALEPSGVEALLGRLDEPGLPEEAGPEADDPVLPWPVLRHTGPLAQVRWRWLAPWVRGVDLPLPTDGLPLRLIRMTAGSHMPHRHTGREVGVVLRGGWTDQWGHHGRGDVAIIEDTEGLHDQRIDADQDCLALVLNDAPAIPDMPLGGWLARWLLRI